MQGSRFYLSLAALILSLPLLGYIWPKNASFSDPLAERDWQWPSVQTQKETEPQPKLLARFWPVPASPAGKMTDEEAAAKAKADALAKQTMKLVAIVRQGKAQQALVLTPKGKLKTLSVGDLLDKQRIVTAISNTSLSWQSLVEPPAQDDTDKHNAKNSTAGKAEDNTAQPSAEPVAQGELTLFPKPVALPEPVVENEAALSEQKVLSEPTALSEQKALSDLTALSEPMTINPSPLTKQPQ